MNIEEESAMCAEFKSQLEPKLPSGWTIVYVGLVDHLPGGAGHHGIGPGRICVKARCRSKMFAEGLTVCIGIGKPDGKKMDPSTVAGFLHASMEYAGKLRVEQRRQLAGG